MRRLAALLLSVTALGGCKFDPYCLNCQDQGSSDAHAVLLDLSSPDGSRDGSMDHGVSTDMSMGGVCAPTNGGIEICDHLDNNCDGVVDNVTEDKLTDPNNCGACFHVCDYVAQHQFGICVGGFDGGVPTCEAGGCIPGWVQLPGHASCDYACTVSNGGGEICDGKDNDCNGKIDDPFTNTWDASGNPNYDKDTSHCGSCAGACTLTGAISQCTPGTNGKGTCTVQSCINTPGVDTWRHNPKAGDINTTGCEYHCPSPSTTAGDCDASPSSCTFPAEACNGIDDDCDFAIDDNLGPAQGVGVACGENCPNGLLKNCVGQCSAGLTHCTNGVMVCVGSTGPKPEICDGYDNDCNGVTDDSFGYPSYNTDPNNCGKCGHVCNLANAINKCVTDTSIDSTGMGVCEVYACKPNYYYALKQSKAGDPYGTCTGGPPGPENGPSGVGCYYACPNPPGAEVCDGKDNDCNGCVDDVSTVPTGFCATQGVCAAGGVKMVCGGSGGWKCDYSGVPYADYDPVSGALLPAEKECDGRDNNCNGVTDLDGFGSLGKTCNAGQGVCQTAGKVGCDPNNVSRTACLDSTSGLYLQPNAAAATDELCNGKDDDCNGQTDERADYTVGSTTFHGWRDPMTKITVAGKAVYVYDYEASRVDATVSSQGGNSARACANLDVIPWSNVTETQAQAACAAITDSAGRPMRLCTAQEWQVACEGPLPPGGGVSAYSYSTNPTTYKPQICNDHSAAGSGVWATGTATNAATSSGEFCYTDWSTAGHIYDLSGNLFEWTSTTVVTGGVTYYGIRGGAYSSPSGGITCEFNFDIAQASFYNNDLGFRCCADNAP
jgi:hypothetical protein